MSESESQAVQQVEKEPTTPRRRRSPNLNHSTYYFNREISWLQFNERVLEEALTDANPLLERVKFLSIFSSNLDEFFMIRISGLRRQLEAGALHAPPDGMSPAQQLTAIRDRLDPALVQAVKCWMDDLRPRLSEAGIQVLGYDELKGKQRKLLRRLFKREIFPVLTPLAFDPGHPFPHISNLSINLAVVINDPGHGEKFARVKVPHMFPRFVRLPSEEKVDDLQRLGLEGTTYSNFVWLEEVVAANLDLLFPGLEVISAHPFRVTRDADVEIEEDEASDLVLAIDEACQNIIRHAYCGEETGEIELQLVRSADALVVSLRDHAPTSDPRCLEAARDLQELRPGGLGTHFIRSVMDEVGFVDVPAGEGNLLRMVKRIGRASA